MDEFELYISGLSIPQVHEKTGIAPSTLRSRFKKAGILRSRADGVRQAGKQGRLGSGMRGKKRVFTSNHKANISKSKLEQGRLSSSAIRITSNGYAEFTRGKNKGKHVHVFAMESRIGRRLYRDECVHHIDGNKLNNDDNNLALVTLSGHSRLHRREDEISGNWRQGKQDGTWS